ncbi:MAG: response regulator [Bdellovibrionales bacterium]|nr:response regulator [Bdellovibrionales bacterium]
MARILLIDDDPDILKFTSRILGGHGHTVFTAKDADQAMDHIHSKDFDLVISDANMPMISGFELIRQIRGLKKHKDLPIALLTGRRQKEDVEKAIEVGVNDYIVKPINPKTLLEKVQSLIASPRDRESFVFQDFVPLVNAQVGMRLIELSTDSMTLESTVLLEKGSSLQVESSVFTQANLGGLNCIVTSIQSQNDYYVVHADFKDLTAQQKRRLQLWIQSRIQESKTKAA